MLCGTNSRKKRLSGLERYIAFFALAGVGEIVVVVVHVFAVVSHVVVVLRSFKMSNSPYLNPGKRVLEGFWEAENFRSVNCYSPARN